MAAITPVFSGQAKSPAEVERLRAIVDQLMGRTAVPRNIGEGLASIGDALVTRSLRKEADAAEAGGNASAEAAMAPIFGALGLGGGEAPTPGSASAPGGANYRDAIAGLESGGKYDALGPVTKGDRAYGKYQIMGANVPVWTQEVLGKSMTPEQFLADPKAQDAVFDAKFGSYVKQFGPEGAAQAWLGGPGSVGKVGRRDVLGTSVGDYGKRFMASVGPQAPVQVASLDPAAGMPAVARGPAPAGVTAPSAIQSVAPPAATIPAGNVPPTPGQTAQAGPQRPAGGAMPNIVQLLSAMQNPWVAQKYGPIVSALLKQQMDQAVAANDPKRALELQKLQAEVDQLKNPRMSPADAARLELDQKKFEADQGKLMEVGPGVTVFDPKTRQPVMTTPRDTPVPAAVQEYEYAKKQGFPGTFQDWEASKKGGMSLQVDPNTGAVTFQQGGNIKPMTEAQSKDAVYATRAAGALPLVDQFGDALTDLKGKAADSIPLVGNYMKSEAYQKAEQAGREFLQAVLRKDTGAAITSQEMDQYGSVYLPQPGDSKPVLDQKKAARLRALEAMKAGMTPQAILAQEQALKKSGSVPMNGTDTDGYIELAPGIRYKRVD